MVEVNLLNTKNMINSDGTSRWTEIARVEFGLDDTLKTKANYILCSGYANIYRRTNEVEYLLGGVSYTDHYLKTRFSFADRANNLLAFYGYEELI